MTTSLHAESEPDDGSAFVRGFLVAAAISVLLWVGIMWLAVQAKNEIRQRRALSSLTRVLSGGRLETRDVPQLKSRAGSAQC